MMSNHSLMSVVSPFLALLILTTNNAAYLMLKHGFPPTKWQDLATALQLGGHVQSIVFDKHNSMSCLITFLKHWMAIDCKGTWRKLKEAMEMSGEPVVARKLYGDTS